LRKDYRAKELDSETLPVLVEQFTFDFHVRKKKVKSTIPFL